MIIDNIITNSLVKEFNNVVLNSKIQKIYQNDLNIFIIDLYSKSNTYKLVISLNPETYRVCLSENKYENKKITSPFLMQLKKYLESGRIISIKQINYDRIIKLEIESYNDIRDKIKLYLIIEITGKYSNLILTDTEYKILGSFRYIDQIKNDERQIILDKPYVPITNKYNKSNFENLSEKDFSKIIDLNES
ncbi:MAG: NFACT family protein, partial [Candidatus Sericytochromatia bacterium]